MSKKNPMKKGVMKKKKEKLFREAVNRLDRADEVEPICYIVLTFGGLHSSATATSPREHKSA